ncbi:MAG: 4Fe-4S single cluster domain-containing protein [Proteobacteria bacterium]|nr:4Fe-4S single cluster domain-containing protein [Pseudomonadota bacterium]
MLRVATISPDTEAEGPGRRWAIWLQGCSLRCAACCNPEMFDPRRGTETTLAVLDAQLVAARTAGVEGITVLGGEPFEQPAGAAALAEAAHAHGLTVMVFSGYELAELRARPDGARFLAAIDLLVDGRYDRTRPEPPPPLGRRWIGSTNQTMHHLTEAYRADDPRMRAANTIEIHWKDGQLLINGWPSADALVRGIRTKEP